MDIVDCYRLLGLRSGASFADIKASYRKLAQQYHPDANPNDKRAKEKFIALTEAYKSLLQVVSQQAPAQKSPTSPPPNSTVSQQKTTTKSSEPPKTASSKENSPPPQPRPLSEAEERLKWKTYEQLQLFLRERRFPQAIALVEALAQRLPEDVEVRQWQAISYQVWGKVLVAEKQLLKARIYLKKALKTDPNNKSLVQQVERDLQKLEQIF